MKFHLPPSQSIPVMISIHELYTVQCIVNEISWLFFVLVKLCLCLSCGQATVERGFLTNTNVINQNLTKESIVAQRIVHNRILKYPVQKTSDKCEVLTSDIQYITASYGSKGTRN